MNLKERDILNPVRMRHMVYQVGQVVEGKVTGIQPYGAFVSIDEQTTGLIHISEISEGYVRDITSYVQVGDIVRVKIIDFDKDNHQARLSLKALHHGRSRTSHKTHGRKATLPEMKLGFSSIAAHMDRWIQEAQEEYKNDEI